MRNKKKGNIDNPSEISSSISTSSFMMLKDFKLDDMERFKEFIISAIESQKKDVQGRAAKRDTSGMSEDEIERFREFDADDYYLVEDAFSEMVMNSFVIILYSYIEDWLNCSSDHFYYEQQEKCKERGEQSIEIKYTDMKGNGIDRAGLYLEKIFKFDLHRGELPWQEIKALQKIRNILVHNGG